MKRYCNRCSKEIIRYLSPKDRRRDKHFYCNTECRNGQYRNDNTRKELLAKAQASMLPEHRHTIAKRANGARRYKGYELICDCCGYKSKEYELLNKPCPKCTLINLKLFLPPIVAKHKEHTYTYPVILKGGLNK